MLEQLEKVVNYRLIVGVILSIHLHTQENHRTAIVMVDIFLEYGYYIVGIGVALFSVVVSYFSIKRYFHDMRIEQKTHMQDLITNQVNRVIEKLDTSQKVNDQKFVKTDQAIETNANATEDIKHDIEVLENDFKTLCQKIGKHDYIVDKILPEYIDLRDSIGNFKTKIDENLLTNNREISRNTEKDIGEEGER